jgi:hypothetical protein
VAKNGYKQAVVVMSLGGPRAASMNDAAEDLIAVRAEQDHASQLDSAAHSGKARLL